MCTVCGCSDLVTADGKVMSHDEAHRLGLAHHHAPTFQPAAAALPFPHAQATQATSTTTTTATTTAPQGSPSPAFRKSV